MPIEMYRIPHTFCTIPRIHSVECFACGKPSIHMLYQSFMSYPLKESFVIFNSPWVKGANWTVILLSMMSGLVAHIHLVAPLCRDGIRVGLTHLVALQAMHIFINTF